jgi:GMP synthase (glutamine-hydrolysing)
MSIATQSYLRFLIIDGYDRPARQEMAESGASVAGQLYQRMLQSHRPEAKSDIIFPADADSELPAPLESYDAMLWTGSSLTVYDDIPQVTRQIELAREGYKAGVLAFGSCWALQIACVAAGGSCRRNPNGREFGLARKILLTQAGQESPYFAGRNPVFDGFSSHFDEVESLPTHATILAGNHHTNIQAANIHFDKGQFFAVQYHPEYDPSEIAGLARFRGGGLIAEGRFENQSRLSEFINNMNILNDKPKQLDIQWLYGIDNDVLDVSVRHNEFANWLNLHFGNTR